MTEVTETLEKEIVSITSAKLLGGSYKNGFGGWVDETEFFTGEELAKELSYSKIYTDKIEWLKFFLDGKTLIIPKRHIAHKNLTKSELENRNLVTGDKTIADKNGNIYRIRLLRAFPKEIKEKSYSKYDTELSEWNRLIIPLLPTHEINLAKKDLQIKDEIIPFNTNFSSWQLGHYATNGIGTRHFCMENYGNTAYSRGDKSAYGVGSVNKSNSSDYYGWRPVFELVTKNAIIEHNNSFFTINSKRIVEKTDNRNNKFELNDVESRSETFLYEIESNQKLKINFAKLGIIKNISVIKQELKGDE